ncbi:hypothetical protein SPLC1_S050900 [Arthrospira platensis C1]|nr:hypothetical protein SPLC1_S050900 [Arthrospira platensis C1]
MCLINSWVVDFVNLRNVGLSLFLNAHSPSSSKGLRTPQPPRLRTWV